MAKANSTVTPASAGGPASTIEGAALAPPLSYDRSPFDIDGIECAISPQTPLADLTEGLRNIFGAGLNIFEQNNSGFSEVQWGALYLLRQALIVAREIDVRVQRNKLVGGEHVA